MSKYSLKRVSYKVKKRAVGVAKRSAALCFFVVIVVGLLLPAGVGYMMEKAGNVGVNTLVASSADTNSSVFTGAYGRYYTGSGYYTTSMVNMGGYQYSLISTSKSESSQTGHIFKIQTNLNKSAILDMMKDGKLDNIKVLTKIDNWDRINSVTFKFWSPQGSSNVVLYLKTININATNSANNSFIKFNVPITPSILLKLENWKSNDVRMDVIYDFSGDNINGRTVQDRIELYDTKGINAVTTKNVMLGASGILLLAVGLCATPWINPSKWYDELFNRRNRKRR